MGTGGRNGPVVPGGRPRGGAAGPHSKWHHKKTRLSQAVPAGAEWHRGCQVVYQGSAIKLFKGLAWIVTPSLVSRIVSTRPRTTH